MQDENRAARRSRSSQNPGSKAGHGGSEKTCLEEQDVQQDIQAFRAVKSNDRANTLTEAPATPLAPR